MSATNTTVVTTPVITNARTEPDTPRKLFVNIPVSDLQRSIRFFEALGFAFNPRFTDSAATCMLVGTDAYFMLLEHGKFASFSKRPAGDPRKETSVLFTFAMESRAQVDEIVHKAIAAGGTHAAEPQDHGFMYGWSFYDPDGYHWEVFWMDPSAIAG